MKKLIVNALVTGLLVTGVGTTTVFADNTDTANQLGTAPTATVQVTAGDETQVQTTAAQEEETPALVPGSFFYFIKIAVEKIELALTFDDVKEALLLAEFTQERILEANALIAEGKTELAAETLQKALESQQLALESSGTTDADLAAAVEESDEEPATNEETAVEVSSEEAAQATVDATNEDAALDSASDDDAEAVVADDEDADEEEADGDNQELKGMLKQNIVSLILAMDRVQNPRAKAALARNIERTFAKMLVKVNKEYAVKEESSFEDQLAQLELEGTVQSEDADLESSDEAAALEIEVEIEDEDEAVIEAEDEDKDEDEASEEAKDIAKFEAKQDAKLQKEIVKALQKAEKHHGKGEEAKSKHKPEHGNKHKGND